MSSPLPNSGGFSTFSTGALRDGAAGKGHFASIPPTALRHLARRFEDGAARYGRDNWMRGIPLSHYVNSINRHLLAWHEGDASEDHAGAVLWNAACMVWTDEAVSAGKLPPELNDLPFRAR